LAYRSHSWISTTLIPGAMVCILSALAASCSRGTEYYISTGNRFFTAGKLDDASLNYRKAIQKDPQSGEALYRLGLAQMKQQKYTEAFSSFANALPLLPGRQDVRIQFGDLCLNLYRGAASPPRALYDQAQR